MNYKGVNMPTKEELKILQSLPLDIKVAKTLQRIREWVQHYGENGVCVSFSGGKDSTVLLHLVRSIYPNVKAVFSDTGLEFPEIRNFVKTIDNVDFVKPKMTFGEVVTKYGYPVFSKEVSNTIWYARKIRGGGEHLSLPTAITGATTRQERINRAKLTGKFLNPFCDGQAVDGSKSIFNQEKYLPACQELPFLISANCCKVTKESVLSSYMKQNNFVPIIGTTAEESRLRTQGWLRTGCNAYNTKSPQSKPLSFWLNQDILRYIKDNSLQICDIYGDICYVDTSGALYDEALFSCGELKCTGANRTGCMYCGYGASDEHKRLGKSRYELLKEKHPQIYDYVLRGGQWVDNPYYDPTAPEIDPVDGWKNWNPEKIWVPSRSGLGMKFVFDEINKIYPNSIRY